MTFYDSIAKYYRSIFPLNRLQVDFCCKVQTNFNGNVLDIGCAIGDFSIALAKKYQNVTAIDLDSTMINMAKAEATNHNNISFSAMNMLHIDTAFSSKSFDLITCFGNTIVHLSDNNLVADFFSKTKQLLTANGKFVFQIINYDRIFNQQLKGLSTIENEEIKFERNYNYSPTDNKVDFATILTIKSNGEKLNNSIPLLALRKNTVIQLLQESGFKNINIYGNFKGDEFTSNSTPLIVEAY